MNQNAFRPTRNDRVSMWRTDPFFLLITNPKRDVTPKFRFLALLRPATLYNEQRMLMVSSVNTMEPVAALVSIVSLLRIFKQERGERTKADHQAFMDWLEDHRHEELKNLIVNTGALRTEVDKVL